MGRLSVALLELSSLTTTIYGEDGPTTTPVDDLSLSLEIGETICLVGESGSGKSMAALSVMRLIELETIAAHRGRILFKGDDLLSKSQNEMREVRGQQIAMVFQEPMTALNPVATIGKQLRQVNKYHHKAQENGAKDKQGDQALIQALDDVGIADPKRVLKQYPHQLSGGMRQRVMIAMALLGSPDLLIADEPTTALDVTTQAQILDLLANLQTEKGMAVLLITHDMAVASEIADRILVMYAGVLIEEATTPEILKSPRHPYTQGLMASVPSMSNTPGTPLASIRGAVPPLDQIFTCCRFSPRCNFATDICLEAEPPLTSHADGRKVACWNADHLVVTK